MLRWRFLLGTLIIAALAGLCWLDARAAVPGSYLMPVVIFITFLATKELLDLLADAGMRPLAPVVHLVNLLLVITAWVKYTDLVQPNFTYQGDFPDLFFIVFSQLELTVGLLVFVIFISEMCRRHGPSGATANVAGGMLAFLYVGMMLHCAVSLRMVFGIGALAAWIIVVKMGDSGAYLIGRLFGRHKLAPLISPGKTIEGAVGGLAFACLGSVLAFQFVVPFCNVSLEYKLGPWWGWIAFGLLVGTAGIFGDLAESLLKRDVGRKDSSAWLPGFGGVLDILDSLLLSAPVAWFCWASGMLGHIEFLPRH